MKRSSEIRPAGQWHDAIDCIVLDADERQCRRSVLTGENGTKFLLDLAHPTMLNDGDGLLLDDGTIVRVTAKPEALVEIAAANAEELTRLAWHLGNRHTAVQAIAGRLRIRHDHVLEDMLSRLGARLTPIEAPFEPELGAYVHGHDNGQ